MNRDSDTEEGDSVDDSTLPPLDLRILQVVKSCPNHSLRPARLASELGMSVDDACAELCALMSAVGGGPGGASFQFTSVQEEEAKTNTMVFTFPPDFEQRALRKRRREDVQRIVQGFLNILIKVIKIVTAFGLILSLCILSIAALVSMVFVMVAMSQSGQRGHRASVHQLRALILAIRDALWMFAVFGPHEGQDPFFREIAYDISLLLSCCYGGPSIFFLWRLQNRRRRRVRGWANRRTNSTYEIASDVEGVSLIRRGGWGDDEHLASANASAAVSDDDRRGFLSVAVEFLFGPSPFNPGPTETSKWKLREAVILRLASTTSGPSVSLSELSPYFDNPPLSLDDEAGVLAGGLLIVAHFNGIPAQQDGTSTSNKLFVFPELMAESTHANSGIFQDVVGASTEEAGWGSFFYDNDTLLISRSRHEDIPSYLQEHRFVFSKLTSKEFYRCLILGILNLVGVIWLNQSLENGVLQLDATMPLAGVLKGVLMPTLKFYALLFFALPGARILLLLALNSLRQRRNSQRARLAFTLASAKETDR